MIQEFVNRFMETKSVLETMFTKSHPDSYGDIVESVIRVITQEFSFNPDPERIHLIDDGDYQGTLLFVIPEKGYQPSIYWYVFVSYGSCSGCDMLEGIRAYSSNPPTPEQVADYMTLALHIAQNIKKMD